MAHFQLYHYIFHTIEVAAAAAGKNLWKKGRKWRIMNQLSVVAYGFWKTRRRRSKNPQSNTVYSNASYKIYLITACIYDVISMAIMIYMTNNKHILHNIDHSRQSSYKCRLCRALRVVWFYWNKSFEKNYVSFKSPKKQIFLCLIYFFETLQNLHRFFLFFSKKSLLYKMTFWIRYAFKCLLLSFFEEKTKKIHHFPPFLQFLCR